MGVADGGTRRGPAVPADGARRWRPSSGGGLAAIGTLAIAAVGLALVSQHVYDMQPCPWCVLQRLIFSVIGVVALIGSVWRAPFRRVVASLVVVLALSGVAAALWQHFKAAASASCSLTVADKLISAVQLDRLLPEVFEPRASCAEAAVSLLGVPYDVWSLALFVAIAIAGGRSAAGAKARRGP